MPLDIQIQEIKPRTEVTTSKTAELIAAVHLLADKGHHALDRIFVEDMYKALSRQSLEMLDMMSSMQFKGLELFDMFMELDVLEDVNLFLERIESYDELMFVYKWFGEEIDLDRIRMIMEDRSSFGLIRERIPHIRAGSAEEHVVYETLEFKRRLLILLREINNPLFHEIIRGLHERYEESSSNIRTRLKDKNPLDLAQEIKGAKLYGTFNFREYVFIPCYFISTHNIIAFSRDRMVFIYNIRKKERGGEGDRIVESLKVISDRTRLEMLRQIIMRPTYGKVLSERLNLTTATISRHLDQLKEANLIVEEKDRNVKYFSANRDEIKKLLDDIEDYLFEGYE